MGSADPIFSGSNDGNSENAIGVISEANVNLYFTVPFEWNTSAVSNYMAAWLRETQPSDASPVGIMSCARFCTMLPAIVDQEVARMLKLLVYVASILHTGDRDPYSVLSTDDLLKLASHDGAEVTNFLHSSLKPNGLAQRSLEDLNALFLIVLGAIVAVTYLPTEKVSHHTRLCPSFGIA